MKDAPSERSPKIDSQVSKLTLLNLTNTLLFGHSSFNDKINTLILDTTIELILSTKRFPEPLFQVKYIAIQYITVYILVVFNQTLLLRTPFIFFLHL